MNSKPRWKSPNFLLRATLAIALTYGLQGCAAPRPGAPIAPLKAPAVDGLVSRNSDRNFEEVQKDITSTFQDHPKVKLVAMIPHSEGAKTAQIELEPLTAFLFGNPAIGTPLMQANQTAGIDLPQKFLLEQNSEGKTSLHFNSPDYLARRHQLGEIDLSALEQALTKLSKKFAGEGTVRITDAVVEAGEGLLLKKSDNDFETTYQTLHSIINSNDKLKIMAELDHQKNAGSIGLELGPTRLLVFGNPAVGSPLMKETSSIGIDLPQKVLVYENPDGEVFLVANDPAYLAKRHNLKSQDEQLGKIRGLLQKLMDGATEKAS